MTNIVWSEYLQLGILSMNNAKMHYFKKEDILHLMVSDEPEANIAVFIQVRYA